MQAAEAMALAEEGQIPADVSILKSLPWEMPGSHGAEMTLTGLNAGDQGSSNLTLEGIHAGKFFAGESNEAGKASYTASTGTVLLQVCPDASVDEELDLLGQMEGWMAGEFEKEDDPPPQPTPLLPNGGSDTTFQFEEFAVHIAGSISGKEALSTRVWRGALVPSPQHSTLNTQHSALNTQHSTLNTQHSTLNTHQWLLGAGHARGHRDPAGGQVRRGLRWRLLAGDPLLSIRTTTSQKVEAVPRRARM